MNTFASVRNAVLAAEDDAGSLQLRRVLSEGLPIEEMGSGTIARREALSMLELRSQTTRQAGVEFAGVDQLISRLRGGDGSVTLFHFRDDDRVFTVVVEAGSGELLGCAWVPRRHLSAGG